MSRRPDPDTHARRRTQLVEAVFRIVRRDGVEHVSVRNVAREAGLSMGSLRHYFGTQAELLAFSLGEVERRLRARLAGTDTAAGTAAGTRDAAEPPAEPRSEPLAELERVLHLLVPMTPELSVEHEIWLAFVGRAVADPALHSLNARVYDDLRELIRRLLAPVIGPDRDLDLETERLYALVDGLVLHFALRPERWDADRLAVVLRRHLDELTAQAS